MAAFNLGELRSLLHQPPSAQVWGAVCELVSGPEWEERAEEWAPYAAQIMDRSWPDTLRVMRLEEPGAARLVRRLAIGQAGTYENRQFLERVLELRPRLHVLDSNADISAALLDRLLGMEMPLRELELVFPCRLRAASSGEAIAARAGQLVRLAYPTAYGEDEAMCAVGWPSLRRLGLGGYGLLEPAALRGWLERAPLVEELDLSGRYCEAALVEMSRVELPALRTLWLDFARVDAAALDALERAPWFPQLRGGLYRGQALPSFMSLEADSRIPNTRPHPVGADMSARIRSLNARIVERGPRREEEA
jgi:hypothetical protein